MESTKRTLNKIDRLLAESKEIIARMERRKQARSLMDKIGDYIFWGIK